MGETVTLQGDMEDQGVRDKQQLKAEKLLSPLEPGCSNIPDIPGRRGWAVLNL